MAKQYLPVLLSFGKGELGSFIRTEKVDNNLVNVHYYPYGFFKSIKAKVIPRVPRSAVLEITNEDSHEPGIPQRYVFLLQGTNGEAILAEKLKLLTLEQLNALREENRGLKIQKQAMKSEVDSYRQGAKSTVKSIRALDDKKKETAPEASSWKDRLKQLAGSEE